MYFPAFSRIPGPLGTMLVSGRLWVDECRGMSSERETGLMSGRVCLVSGRLWVDEWQGVSSEWETVG